MNSLDWDGTRTLPRNVDPNLQNNVTNSMDNASRTNSEWDTYCEYLKHTVHEAQSSMGVNVGWRGTPPSHNFCIKDSEVQDPDGEPLERDEEDPELARKRKELREIEERIILKRAAIALKTVEPLVKKTTPPDFNCNEQLSTCKVATLKDRVNVILQQRHIDNFLSKVRSPTEGMNSSSLNKDGLQQDDHPLKLRVKALMKQRCSDPFVLPASSEVPDVTPPPPSRSATSPAKEEKGINKGFQRFLSVLNKGVDMDFLSRIVNDDSAELPLGEELLNIEPPAVENMSDPPLRRESQRLSSGSSLPGCSRTSSGERKTDPLGQQTSLDERLDSLLDDEKKKNDRGDRCFGSSSQSKCPSAVKKKKTKKEEGPPKVDKQHEQLQNILKTLGMSLEVEEMSKLADRTQERLYGKKHEDARADSRGEQEGRQRGSQRHYSNSPSSSSSSSRSTSRSFSPSPTRRRRSHSRDSRRGSRDGSRDELKCQDGNQDGKEAQRYRDKDEDGEDSKEICTYQHPYQQNQTYPDPHLAAFSDFPDYSLSQNSQYTAYHTGTYSNDTESYWTRTQDAIPPSCYPSECPYPQNAYHHFLGSVEAPNTVYPRHDPHCDSVDVNLFMNPDLSKSEGQVGSLSGPRCLQVISTKQPATDRCLHTLTKGRQRKGRYETRMKRCRLYWKKKKERLKQQKIAAKESADSVAPQLIDGEDDSEAEQSEEEKRPPTEEEIKANLRKTLEAFNQMAKQRVTQPANSLSSLTE